MELKKTSSILFFLNGLIAALITLMGGWWLYLLFSLSNRLALLETQTSGPNIARLIKWEGSFFIILLIIITVSHFILLIKDQKKNRSIHAFFAGLTHELKTPLASIRLQSEVIKDEAQRIENQRLDKLTDRLLDDTSRLEIQMDKVLQLSRVERDGNLNLRRTSPYSLIGKVAKNLDITESLELIDLEPKLEVWADQFALELVFTNLFENTKNHTDSKNIIIKATKGQKNLTITYKDGGVFNGDISKLGKLFYKHESKKGSGIGLYLSKKLLKKMKGNLSFKNDNGLIFKITLPLEQEQA